MSDMSISKAGKREKVLAALAAIGEERAIGFSWIQEVTGLTRREVRLSCRALKRAGLAAFHVGLWTDDGAPAGSGYSATNEGRSQADPVLTEKYADELYDA